MQASESGKQPGNYAPRSRERCRGLGNYPVGLVTTKGLSIGAAGQEESQGWVG